ncbi:hypothetical protein [Cylindrospermopsis raciborskii]|uniref:hypothetical protein n=1 Tax=Cylindrospermopsis raciborskii TaxID=77022 RepID=UPI0038D190AA
MPRKQQVPKKEEPKQETKLQIISVVRKTAAPPPVESNPDEIIPPAEENKKATPQKAARKKSQKPSPVVLDPPPPRDVTPPVEIPPVVLTPPKDRELALPIEMVPSTEPDVTQPVETTLLKDQEVGEPDVESLSDEKPEYKKKEKFYIFKRPYKLTLKGDINLIEWECACGYENEVSVLVGREILPVFCPQCGKPSRFQGTLLSQKGATVGDEPIPDVSP